MRQTVWLGFNPIMLDSYIFLFGWGLRLYEGADLNLSLEKRICPGIVTITDTSLSVATWGNANKPWQTVQTVHKEKQSNQLLNKVITMLGRIH